MKSEAQQTADRIAGAAAEGTVIWTETGQKLFQQWVSLAAATARESGRLYGELLESAAGTLTAAAAQFQAAAGQAGRQVQEILAEAAARTRALYLPEREKRA